MEYFVYVITNPQGKIYIGQTGNIEKRMLDHNEGGNGYTSKFRPWKLAALESYPSKRQWQGSVT